VSDDDKPGLGELIAKRRVELGLAKSEAARRAKMARGTWIDLESGRRTNPLTSTLHHIDEALDWTPGTLRSMLAPPRTDDDKLDRVMALIKELREIPDVRVWVNITVNVDQVEPNDDIEPDVAPAPYWSPDSQSVLHRTWDPHAGRWVYDPEPE